VTTATARGWPVAVRRSLRKHTTFYPEWWLYAISLLAWFTLLTQAALEVAHGSALHHLQPSVRAGDVAPTVGHAMVMTAAMMLPLVVPHARVVVRRGLWVDRYRAITAFTLGYLAVWCAFSVGLETVFAAAGRNVSGPGPTMLLLLVAAAWHCTPARRSLWRRCCGLAPMAATGRRAAIDRFRAGQRIGRLCVGTCGPVMAVMSVSHGIGTAVWLSAVLLAEHRRGPNPAQRLGAPNQAAWLVALAGVIGLAATVPAVGHLG
jgi:predicted metal-binding membrane protein